MCRRRVPPIYTLSQSSLTPPPHHHHHHHRQYHHPTTTPSVAYTRQWIWSALVQILVCRLFGAKLLSQPNAGFLSYGQTSATFYSKYKAFHPRKCIWKYRLRNDGHFVQEKMSLPHVLSNRSTFHFMSTMDMWGHGQVITSVENYGSSYLTCPNSSILCTQRA